MPRRTPRYTPRKPAEEDWCQRVGNPVLVAVTAVIGLIGFQLLRPEWVFVKQDGEGRRWLVLRRKLRRPM